MKQTAVEWLVERLEERHSPRKWKEIIEQASEMESQQKGYSEEEVLHILDIILSEYRDSLKNKTDFYPVLRFEQFKNK